MNPMEYFYENLYEEDLPAFAALAVFEGQSCPEELDWFPWPSKEITCTSRYRVIRVLDAASDTLKKEYLEVKERPLHPYFRHRPILIFGKYKNGLIQIEKYEETREYFDTFDYNEVRDQQIMRFGSLLGFLSDIYAFHAIGTPYFKNLDSIDVMFLDEFLLPKFKFEVMTAGKDFNELWQRLTQNRTSIKASKTNSGFVALGVIKSMHPVSNSKRAKLYELSVVMETVFKNDAKIDSDIAILIDGKNLPLGYGCMPLNFLYKTPFYLFGNLKDGGLVIDSLVSTLDVFVFGDTIYDISMGFPFRDLATYLLPQNISLEELEFNAKWSIFNDNIMIFGEIPEKIAFAPECLVNDIKEINIKHETYDKKKFELAKEKKIMLVGFPFLLDNFRCRKRTFLDIITPDCDYSNYNYSNERLRVWGR
jgi:hypothetical protein